MGSNQYNLGSTTNLNVISSWVELPFDTGDGSLPTGANSLPSQIARFTCTCVTAGGTGTLGVALVDASDATNPVLALYKATITATSDQAGSALASGDYLCTTAFADGTDKLDLLGLSNNVNNRDSTNAISTTDAKKCVWKAGLYSASSTGVVTLTVHDTRAI